VPRVMAVDYSGAAVSGILNRLESYNNYSLQRKSAWDLLLARQSGWSEAPPHEGDVVPSPTKVLTVMEQHIGLVDTPSPADVTKVLDTLRANPSLFDFGEKEAVYFELAKLFWSGMPKRTTELAAAWQPFEAATWIITHRTLTALLNAYRVQVKKFPPLATGATWDPDVSDWKTSWELNYATQQDAEAGGTQSGGSDGEEEE
jgi:hypothetical protein